MTKGKILTPEQVDNHARSLHGRIVLATGVFDIIHPGHIRLFERAALHGMLWVGLNSDAAVRALKGPTRPVNNYDSRAIVVAGLDSVDKVFEIDDVRVAKAIQRLAPVAWFKGGDYTMETLDKMEVAAANEVGCRIVLVPTYGDYSTTRTLEKLQEKG